MKEREGGGKREVGRLKHTHTHTHTNMPLATRKYVIYTLFVILYVSMDSGIIMPLPRHHS